MDYLKIVTEGFLNPTSKEHLESYFYREYKKAEKEHYTKDEFFGGCMMFVRIFEANIEKKMRIELLKTDNPETINKSELTIDIEKITNGRFIGKMTNINVERLKHGVLSAKFAILDPIYKSGISTTRNL